jgi:hypothetical protein
MELDHQVRRAWDAVAEVDSSVQEPPVCGLPGIDALANLGQQDADARGSLTDAFKDIAAATEFCQRQRGGGRGDERDPPQMASLLARHQGQAHHAQATLVVVDGEQGFKESGVNDLLPKGGVEGFPGLL